MITRVRESRSVEEDDADDTGDRDDDEDDKGTFGCEGRVGVVMGDVNEGDGVDECGDGYEDAIVSDKVDGVVAIGWGRGCDISLIRLLVIEIGDVVEDVDGLERGLLTDDIGAA